MTSSGPAFFSETSPTVNSDSMESFKHFLDIVAPLEFAKLLRARVKHLLETWPPQSASTVPATSSPSLTPSNACSPSVESVRGFAAFFRTQDSPSSSPIDVSATTSLQALHSHLLALQTLLSFLSARELQDIVRTRLSESGKDRSAAVQGLMDVMRDPEGEDTLEQLVGKEGASLIGGIRRSDNDGKVVEAVDQPLMPTGQVPPSDINVGKRKAILKSCGDLETEAEEGVLPPKKRQRSENETGDGLEVVNDAFPKKSQADCQNPSNASFDVSNQSTFPPVSAFPPPDASSSPSTLVASSTITENSDSTVVRSEFKSEEEPHSETDKDVHPTSNSELVSESSFNGDSRREKSVVENHDDMKADASDLESRASTNILHSSDVEDEGLVVTLIEEDTAKRGPQAISSSPTEPLPTAQEEQVSSDSPLVPAPTSNTRPGEENPTPPVPFDADLEVGLSLAEWNRKRVRDLLCLPPKGPQNVLGDIMDAAITANTASTAQEEIHPKADCTTPNFVPKTNETATDSSEVTANSAITDTQDASVASARPHTPATTPHAGLPISRSPTPSIRGSSCGSPPGPMLRAVDWDSRPFHEETDSDMELDEFDELDGSEDTLAVGNGAPYNSDVNADGVLKFPTYNGTFTYQHAWPNVHGYDGRMWDHADPKAYDVSNEISQVGDQSQGADTTDPQPRLTIRLPARGSKGDNGVMSTGTDGSDSGSASPSSQSPYPLAPSSGQPGIDYERIDNEQGLSTQRIRRLSPLVSGPSPSIPHATGSSGSTDTSSLPPSHGQSQASSASHTPNMMPGAVPHGLRFPPGAHPQSYPPPHPYNTQWICPMPMIYVPYHHAQGQGSGYPPPQMYSPSQMQMSPTPGSKSGGESGPSPVSVGSPGPMGIVMTPGGSNGSSPHMLSDGHRGRVKRRALGEGRNSDGERDGPELRYTDDVGVKETAILRRFCNNCQGMQAPSWRKSKLNVGKILCNKCGIYESTHMTPRPLKTRPRRSNMEALAAKRRKNATKKLAPAPATSRAQAVPQAQVAPQAQAVPPAQVTPPAQVAPPSPPASPAPASPPLPVS